MTVRPTRAAVLGAGNGGQAMAAELAMQGHQVTLYEHPSMIERFGKLLKDPRIAYKADRSLKQVPLSGITSDMKAAVDEASLINIVVPAPVHDMLFEELLPLIGPEQVVLVWAGRFGALRLREMLREAGSQRPASIVELNTLPYWVRMSEPGHVEVLLRAKQILFSSVEPQESATHSPLIKALHPYAESVRSPIQVALDNSALVVLPLVPLLNVGGIEQAGDDYHLFRDGVTPTVGRFLERAYLEIENIAAQLGLSITHYRSDEFRATGSIESSNFSRPENSAEVFERIKGPASIRHRFVLENIPYGLVPISSLARLLRIDTPLIDACIEIASALCESDFRKEGRTMEALGIRDKEDVHALIAAA